MVYPQFPLRRRHVCPTVHRLDRYIRQDIADGSRNPLKDAGGPECHPASVEPYELYKFWHMRARAAVTLRDNIAPWHTI
jgi:hypothetical protein